MGVELSYLTEEVTVRVLALWLLRTVLRRTPVVHGWRRHRNERGCFRVRSLWRVARVEMRRLHKGSVVSSWGKDEGQQPRWSG